MTGLQAERSETVAGLIEFGGDYTIHIAAGVRRPRCGARAATNAVNWFPIGAVRLDDPHLCIRCREARTS